MTQKIDIIVNQEPPPVLEIIGLGGPKGDYGGPKGDKGDHGDRGATGPAGADGINGADGTNATVTTIVKNATPTGAINSINTAFTTASAFASGTLDVYKNGIRLKGAGNDYTEVAGGFNMVTAPATGTVLLCDYIIEQDASTVGVNTITTDATPTGLVNSVNKAFTTGQYIGGSLEVYINGVKQQRVTHFTEVSPANGTFTVSDAPLTGDNVQVNYQTNLTSTGSADTLDGIHADVNPVAGKLLPLNGSAKFPSGVVAGINSSFRFRCNTGGARTTISGAAAVLPGFSNNTVTPAADGIIFGNLTMMCYGTSGATQIWLYVNGVSRETDFGGMYFDSAHWQTFTIPFEFNVTAETTYTIGAWCKSSGSGSVCNGSGDAILPTEINGILIGR